MKAVILVLLFALAANAMEWVNCGELCFNFKNLLKYAGDPGDHLTVDSVKFTPDPPVVLLYSKKL